LGLGLGTGADVRHCHFREVESVREGGCLTFDRCTVLLQKEFAFNQLYSAVAMELYTELILIQFIHCVNGDGSKTAEKSLKR